jgi:PncC family amidohydrolase
MPSENEHATKLDDATVHLSQTLGSALRRRRLTLSVAESATGGLIGHVLTEVPGSSDYFVGDVIAYSSAIKTDLLHVPKTVLERHGAVSDEAAAAMAQGIRKLLRADVGVASTGIAGPTGATPSKPVGLTYVAVELPSSKPIVRRYEFNGSRSSLKAQFARAALQLLLDCVEGRVGVAQPS